MTANVSPEEDISRLFSLIGQPARIKILWVIEEREACVCHLEAVTGMRQASISQHLMVLRKAGLVEPQRHGRNIFYHLQRPEIISVFRQAALIAGHDPESLQVLTSRPVKGCPCPQCNPESNPESSCQNLQPKKKNGTQQEYDQ